MFVNAVLGVTKSVFKRYVVRETLATWSLAKCILNLIIKIGGQAVG